MEFDEQPVIKAKQSSIETLYQQQVGSDHKMPKVVVMWYCTHLKNKHQGVKAISHCQRNREVKWGVGGYYL